MSEIFNVLRRPIVTEKTNYMATKLHQYAFEVAENATRTLVKEAIEKAFKVTVTRVNIIVVPAKQSRRPRNRRLGIRVSSFKKAIVTLLPTDRIPIFEGVD